MVRRSTWIMLLLFAALVGFAFFFQRNRATQAVSTATPTPTIQPVYLFSLGDSELSNIKIVAQAGKSINLYRDQSTSKWAITNLPPGQADSTKIDSIGTEFRSMQIEETLSQTIALSSIGLELPAYTITLTTTLGTQFVAYVGIQTAIGSGYYIREPNGQVAIVGKTPMESILNLIDNPPLLPTATPEVTPPETVTPVP
jgi:Domain of unknown function (DUF4340)